MTPGRGNWNWCSWGEATVTVDPQTCNENSQVEEGFEILVLN